MKGLYTYGYHNRKGYNDLLICARLGYDMGTRGWLSFSYVLWYAPIANLDEPRESRLKELIISLILKLGVKTLIYNFTSSHEVKL